MYQHNCCVPGLELQGQGHEAEFDVLDLSDPTMASCCQRELENEEKAARIISKLRSADRVDERARIKAEVIKSVPEEDGLMTDSDEDGELSKLRELRLQELHRARSQAHQSGELLIVKEETVLGEIRHMDGTCVLLLTIPGEPVCQEALELLEVEAHRHRDVHFLQTVMSRKSHLSPQLGIPHGPAFILWRDGALIEKALIAQFCNKGNFLDEKVTSWLRKRCYKFCQEEADHESSGGEDDNDWREPCQICGRRYFHEHVRPKTAYPGDQGGTDDED